LPKSAKVAEGWIALTSGVVGESRALYRAVVAADLEGIVAKKLTDPYNPQHTRWHKILNRDLLAASGACRMVPRAALCQEPGTGRVNAV